jgi:hypothetical protein
LRFRARSFWCRGFYRACFVVFHSKWLLLRHSYGLPERHRNTEFFLGGLHSRLRHRVLVQKTSSVFLCLCGDLEVCPKHRSLRPRSDA